MEKKCNEKEDKEKEDKTEVRFAEYIFGDKRLDLKEKSGKLSAEWTDLQTDNMDKKEEGNVTIPTETLAASNTKRKRTLRQMPIYRDMANLKYLAVTLYNNTPRKLTRYLDTVLSTTCEAKKCIGLAEATRDPIARIDLLDTARVFVEDISDDITILHRLNIISRDTERKLKSLAKGIIAQALAFRDYTHDQGVNHY